MQGSASFGYLVRRRRKALDFTQRELAGLVSCATVTIQKIEADERRPSAQMATLLAEHLAVPAGERDAFLLAARGERSPARLAIPHAPVMPLAGELPVPLTDFVGRAAAVLEVERLLRGQRLVTLTGPGGSGKTRLAVEVARRHAAVAVRFVALATVRESDLLVRSIADAVGADPLDPTDPAGALQAHLHARALLLVLDNCEQLEGAAEVVAGLLAAAPRLAILATSRRSLRVAGEQEYEVPPMDLPSLGRPELWPALLRVESVALFVHRARAVRPDLATAPDDALAIAELVVRLDGLPLAIELAAARTRVLGPQALLGRLGQGLDLLGEGPRDAPARQRTLRATLAWSYELLDQAEREAFARLGVFAGWFDLDAAEAVLPHRPALDTLASFVDQHLVETQVAADGEPRFRMLETIREYALEQLGADPAAAAVHRAHLEWCAALVEQAERGFFGSDQPAWLARLDEVNDDLRGVLDRAVRSDRAERDTALAIAGRLCWFWHLRGHWGEGRARLRALLDASPAAPVPDRARARFGLGLLAWALDDYAASAADLEAAAALADPDREPWLRAHALGMLGLLRLYELRPEAARAPLDESLRLFEGIGDGWGTALTGLRGAIAARLLGDLDRATALAGDSLSRYRAAANPWGVATSLSTLAELALDHGDWRQAADHYREALATMRTTGSAWYLALLLIGVAAVAAQRGQPTEAATLLGAIDAAVDAARGRIPPIDRRARDQVEERLRAELGAAFDTAAARGAALSDAAPDEWLALADTVLAPSANMR